MAELVSKLGNTFFYLIAETCDKGSPVAFFFFLSHSLSFSLPFFFYLSLSFILSFSGLLVNMKRQR